MSKAIFGFLVAASLALCLCLFAWASETEEAETKNLDDIRIENEGYERDIKGHVPFSHLAHAKDYGISCWNCHHVYEEGENTWSPWGDPAQKCSTCHDPNEKQGDVDKLQNAYHNNCKDCHKALAAEEKPTGPFRKCNDCHQKEE